MTTASRVDKQNAARRWSITGDADKWTTTTCYDTDEPWKHGAQWKKPLPETKSQKTPLLWNVQNNQIYRNRKMRGAARGWKKGETESDSSWIPRFLCEAMQRSNIREQGWLDKSANTKNQQTAHIWRVNVTVRELNSNAHSFAWAGTWPVSLGREETWSAQQFLGFVP